MDLRWCLPWVSKPQEVPLVLSGGVLHYTRSAIHPWCYTCQPIAGWHDPTVAVAAKARLLGCWVLKWQSQTSVRCSYQARCFKYEFENILSKLPVTQFQQTEDISFQPRWKLSFRSFKLLCWREKRLTRVKGVAWSTSCKNYVTRFHL